MKRALAAACLILTGCATRIPTPPPRLPTVTVTWNTQPDAHVFNIYRDGEYVGTVTTEAFLDKKPHHGANVYTVTAVNEGGESKPSKSSTAEIP